ncbi:MAG TPA: 2Fe-2S iron-sulfur cluster-binding protein [Ilumatobacter sp.]|nr:2Fe-2S iron-sulfur cluster-binding protein [Ilumatobacter sp.]
MTGTLDSTLDSTATSMFTALRVASVEHDTPDSVIIEFDDHPDFRHSFQHGQHLTLRREFDGVEVRRSYSLCSPAPNGSLRVGIKHVAGGVFSSWATGELGVGDTIDVMAPSGHFTHALDPAARRRYTLLAAGSGITPVFSIAATVLECEPQSTVSLLYINRSSQTTMLLDELHDLRDRFLHRFQVSYLFTREDTSGDLLSGRPDADRLDALISAGILPAVADHAFLCGPIDLIAEASDALGRAGLDGDCIHREIFTAPQQGRVHLAPPEVTETSVVVATGKATLHGRATPFDMFDGDTVLDAVQRVRPDAPFSCRAGVCSTCQAVLCHGEIDMAVNYGLSNDEVARGYILTCQAVPTTAEVHVDFDA